MRQANLRLGGENFPQRAQCTNASTIKTVRPIASPQRLSRALNLVVVHNHFRPGGVRRVIELALPSLLTRIRPRISRLLLLSGEAPDDAWWNGLRRQLPTVPLVRASHPSLGYFSEQSAAPLTLRQEVQTQVTAHLDPLANDGAVVWAHNQGLGRNLLLTEALTEVCDRHQFPLLFHHHDWWFDNRWPRWPEMRASGFRTLASVARTVFPASPWVRHAAINQAEAALLTNNLGTAASWLPNPSGSSQHPAPEDVATARRWLERRLKSRDPIWLVPCRLLRRKNLAEALLLTRWLRPEAWLVTTGGVSSAAELPYAHSLHRAASDAGWKLCLGLLQDARSHPPVAHLLAASEVALLTSVQEGFGLPYLEAAAAGSPLIARSLSYIAPDLAKFGFQFPQSYPDLAVDLSLFNHRAEQRRQRELFREWSAALPSSVRNRIPQPNWWNPTNESVPFSRLTLSAQLEVLRQPVEQSWARCESLNPQLSAWRDAASLGQLKPSSWPRTAASWLGQDAYGKRLQQLLQQSVDPPTPAQSLRCQEDLMDSKLQSEHLYPLLWNSET